LGPAENYERLRALIAMLGQREAWVSFTGEPVSRSADRIGANRASVSYCVNGRRKTAAILRALEAEYDLPVYALDHLFEER